MVEATNSQSGPHSKPRSFATLVVEILITGTLFIPPAHAGALRWSLPIESRGEFEISNPTGQTAEAYRKDFGAGTATGIAETRFEIPAHSRRSFSAQTAGNPAVVDIATNQARVQWRTPSGRRVDLPAGQSNSLFYPQGVPRVSGELIIVNLSSQSQDGRILSRKSENDGQELFRFRLGGRESLKLDVGGLPGTAFFESFSIETTFNAQSFVKGAGDDLVTVAQLRNNPAPLPAPRGRYFVVANSDRSAAYLVDLTDAAMIAEARAQIRQPDTYLPRILVAEIEVNQSGDNRNWDDKLKHPWSWRVGRPLRFASLASQACDGHPQQVEDRLESWLSGAATGGRPVICFWGYQIVEEIP